jgi:hypothetical protein
MYTGDGYGFNFLQSHRASQQTGRSFETGLFPPNGRNSLDGASRLCAQKSERLVCEAYPTSTQWVRIEPPPSPCLIRSPTVTQPLPATRRDFLFTATAASVAAALPTIVPARALGRDGATSPSEKITLGVIGIGPRCTYDLQAMLKFPDIRCVAIADVQASRRDAGKKLVDEAYGNTDLKLYRDFRELLDRKDIDAVLIATGDRWHSAASILAAKAGKDVYSEKPCGITIADCQRLADTMHQEKRVFQAGTQRRSVPNFQTAVEMAHSGKLGKLHTLHASIYVPVLDNTWLPPEPQPTRDVVDWNLWLGPAAWRPYNQKYVAGRWRGQWDFDSGARVLDWGAHTVDLCQWANQADDTMPIEYEPSDKNIVCTYANGVKLILDFLPEPFGKREPHYITRLGTCPVRFIGDAGWVEMSTPRSPSRRTMLVCGW